MSVNWAPSEFRNPAERKGSDPLRAGPHVRSSGRAETHVAARSYRVELVDAAKDQGTAAERRDLARRALSVHPFQLPGFEDAAPGRLAPLGCKRLLARDGEGRLVFSSPVTIRRLPWGGRHMIIGFWSVHYAPLGGPLIDGDEAEALLPQLLQTLRKRFGIHSCAFPFLRLRDPFAELVERHAEVAGLNHSVADRHARAALHGPQDSAGFYNRTVSKKRRKEFSRLYRRLGEEGAVTFETLREPERIGPALEQFLDMEASGWKGRAGTALKRSKRLVSFVRAATASLAAEGHVRIDRLLLDGRPVAQLIRFAALGEAVAWKIAHDERLGAYSPGALLMIEVLRESLDDPAIRRTDSLAVADHPMIDHIWRSRETVGDVRLGLDWRGRLGIAFLDLLNTARQGVRAMARRLLRRKHRT